MGDFGSGRWNGYQAKTTTSQCRHLDISGFYKKGFIRSEQRGTSTWHNEKGEETAAIGWQIDAIPGNDEAFLLKLSYQIKSKEDWKSVEQSLLIVSTRLWTGGKRWWFRCGLEKNGKPCRRRIGKIYLPPGGKFFGCRHCYELTYRSSQESRKPPVFLVALCHAHGITPAEFARSC